MKSGHDGCILTGSAPSAVDWNFPSPTVTPTSGSFNQTHFHTPKTATLPSQFFQDAFSTPQMPGYATPRQQDFPSVTPMQRAQQQQHTSSDVLRSNYYANVQASGLVPGQVMPPPPSQAGYQAPVVSPIYGYSQALPAQPGQTMAFDSSHMQTPPPTRGTSVRKSAPSQPIAFGTPSTIASRRFLTPEQQLNNAQQQAHGVQNHPMQFPQLQFSSDVYQFGNFGPASAPVYPQTQLLWENTASPMMYNQQAMLDDPFAPTTTDAMGWPAAPVQQNNMQSIAFNTPVMSSFPVQPPVQRPASAAPVANNQTPQPPPVSAATSVNPSLVYSSPMRPVVQSVPRQSKSRNTTTRPAAPRKDSANADHQRTETATSADAIITPVSKNELRRSNTTGTSRPSTSHTIGGGESFARSRAVLQPPRTASPLKRVGQASLGSISETKHARPRASVILTIDENGRARTQTTRTEDDSPEKAMRERYPGLFDSDSSDDESEEEEQTPSRSASFSFAKGEERKSKAAKLDPPVENLEGLSLPRSSSAASMKVTPSRAAIAAAAQLRRGGSLRKQTPSRNGQRRVASNAASFIDTAPMDVPADRRQSMINAEDTDSRMDWAGNTLNEHNRRWSMMSMEQQSSVSPTHPPSDLSYPSQRTRQPVQQRRMVRCICGTSSDGGQTLIQCHSCTQWVHTSCVGLDPTALPSNFTCFLCTKPAASLNVSGRRS